MRRCRGTAMLEFIMCIPLMVIVIAGIFFFGWVMRNQQRIQIADRYASWKSVHSSEPSTQHINEKFFDDRGYDIYMDLDSDTITKNVRDSFIDSVTNYDTGAGQYSNDLINRNLPGGSYSLLRSQFDTNSPKWRKWAESGAMERTHVRDGLPWVRGETFMPYSIRDIYLKQLDDFVTAFPSQGSSGGDMIQTLYMSGW